MAPLPELPDPPAGEAWNPHIHHAFEILCDISSHTTQTLQSPGNMHRLRFYIDTIVNDSVPLLCALEEEGQQIGHQTLTSWAQDTALHARAVEALLRLTSPTSALTMAFAPVRP